MPDTLPFETCGNTIVGVGVWAFIMVYENRYSLAMIKHNDNAMFLTMITSFEKPLNPKHDTELDSGSKLLKTDNRVVQPRNSFGLPPCNAR